MKWVLTPVLLTPTGALDAERQTFDSKAECVAAGEAYADLYPSFTWLGARDGEGRIENAVYGSTFECVSINPDGRDRSVSLAR